MTFTWHFFTGGRPPTPVGRKCHRGPMTDLEVMMSEPFTVLTEFNTLKQRLLDNIVDTTYVAVRTREIVLRCLNGSIQAAFPSLLDDKPELQVLICEKRDSVAITDDLVQLKPFYLSAAQTLLNYNILPQYVQVITDALKSNSPVVIVEGMCAVILWATLLEWEAIYG